MNRGAWRATVDGVSKSRAWLSTHMHTEKQASLQFRKDIVWLDVACYTICLPYPPYFCFIDYTKAFGYVNHNKLWKILKEMGIPGHLIWSSHSLNLQWWIQNNMYWCSFRARRITEYTEKLLAHSNFKFSQGSFPWCLSLVLYSSLGMILPGFVSVLGLQFPPLRHVSFFIRKLTLQLISLLNLCPNILFALHCLNFLITQIVMLPWQIYFRWHDTCYIRNS